MASDIKDKIGKLPGTLVYTGQEDIEKTLFRVVKYDPDGYSVDETYSLEDALKSFEESKVNWLKVEGLSNTESIAKIGKHFNIHALALEDILNVNQLPKIDVFDDYIFVTLKLLKFNAEENIIEAKHVSLILGKYWFLTFQEHLADSFQVIRDRIASMTTKVKQRKADYLFYYLIDLIVDQYYLIIDVLNKQTEQLELEVMESSKSDTVANIILHKKKYSELKAFIEPLNEMLRDFKRSETPLCEEYVQTYFDDVNDHVKQYLEAIQSQQDHLSSLIDLHMSILSTKMNKVMYILTIVMTIFVPLTFIAGIYGMNFVNIPELEYENGYFVVLGVMAAIGIGILIYMKRKRWF